MLKYMQLNVYIIFEKCIKHDNFGNKKLKRYVNLIKKFINRLTNSNIIYRDIWTWAVDIACFGNI